MAIRKWILVLVLFYSTISLALNQRDSISIDPRWNYWHVEGIAPSGDWAFVYQIFPNDRMKHNKAFVVNTDTKQKVEVTGIDLFNFTTNNYLIGRKGTETLALDLITQKETSLGKLKKQDWVEAEQLMVYISENKELLLRKYSTKGAKDILKREGVVTFYSNPSKTALLYQKEGSTIVYLLDLKGLREKEVLDLKEPLNTLTWNYKEDAVAMILQNKDVGFLDLEKRVFKKVSLSKSQEPITTADISFFNDNDLYINYGVRNSIENPTEDFLDIWNGNDRELKYKKKGKPEVDFKTVIYRQQTKEILELATFSKQNYVNIGIPNYLLVYDPLEFQDYTQSVERIRYRILQLKPFKELGDLTTTEAFLNLYAKSPIGNAILYNKGSIWEVYDFDTHLRVSIPHQDALQSPTWTSDGKGVFYSDGKNVILFNLETHQDVKITDIEGKNKVRFLNVSPKRNLWYVDMNKPFLFSVYHDDYKTSYYSWFKNKLTCLVKETAHELSNYYYLTQGISRDGKTAAWSDEDYKQPHTLKVFRKGKLNTLLEPKLPEELYNWGKQKVIHYKDKYGVDLTGVLWYPKDFDKTKKYPMITWIYQRQGSERSVFEIPSLYNPHGFNRALMTEQGYFVFQPDTYVSEEGAGLSALECVTKGIENITALEPAIDKTKIGLAGHSFGGYETSFILGNSKLFAAGVSGGGVHDLINYNYEYNYHKSRPNFYRVEGPQFSLDPFNDNPIKYYKNSPIHFAHNYTAPILLWTGMQDFNVHWEQTRHMYVALKRYKKPVIALFYKKEEHSINLERDQKDLTLRFLDWFDFYLKDKKEMEWISKGVDYMAY